MHKDLDKLLVEKFPILYADRYEDLRESSMLFGFQCGDGWFNLIHDLSEKIERIIETSPEGECRYCGHIIEKHGIRCSEITIIGADYPKEIWGRCTCEKYVHSRPRASTVKEKYARLRFYMHGGSDEIEDLITKAEDLSETICEECGQPGSIQEHRKWLKCCCQKCYEVWTHA